MAITIIGAAYGAVDGGQNMASNVTTTLQNLVNKNPDKDFTFRPNNQLFGDLSPGHDKSFGCVYTNSSSALLALSCNEGEQATLTAKTVQGIMVVAASYGTVASGGTSESYDVTVILQNLVDQNPKGNYTFTPATNLFGDPAPGHNKSFGCVYKDQSGQQQAAACREGESITLFL